LFSRRQIALADLVILNKTDLAADQAQLQSHKTRIRFVQKQMEMG
jgi:G3E family GTPase